MIKKIFQFPYFLFAASCLVALILASFPLALILMLFPKKIKDLGMFIILKSISYIGLTVIGMIPVNYHRRKIDFSKGYLLMPNHQSLMDAALIYTSIPKPFKTLGKIELEKVPIYGIIYKLVVITVDRSSVTAKANSIRKMKKELDNGLSVAIFPEGTFADQPQPALLPFQKGGFSLAFLQQADILPILYLDAAERLHPSKVWNMTPGLNRSVFLPPIRIADYHKDQVNDLMAFTQIYMQSCLDYCRAHSPDKVWAYAIEWQKNNTLVP